MEPVAFTLREVISVGAIFFSLGGLTAWTTVNTLNIRALWDKKQDINVCVTEHTHVSESLERIEDQVDWLVKDRKNGGS